MKPQLTSAALFLGLTLSSAFAMATDAQLFVFECSVVRKVRHADGTASAEPVAKKTMEISDNSKMEIPISVKTGKQTHLAKVVARTIIQQIPDFPQAGELSIHASMMMDVNFEHQGKGTATNISLMDSSEEYKYPLVSTGALFNFGPYVYVARCSVNEKENVFSSALEPALN